MENKNESRNKNIIIGGLIAIVFVMAVGFAAFSTTLNINGTATIDSKWDVHYDKTNTAGVGTAGLAGGTTPTGTIKYDNDLTATLDAKLYQPGDKVVFTLKIVNAGTLNAQLATPTVAQADTTGNEGTVNGLVYTSKDGNIKYTVTAPTPTTINAGDTTTGATMTVTAEFVNNEAGNNNANGSEAKIKVTTVATQAAQ